MRSRWPAALAVLVVFGGSSPSWAAEPSKDAKQEAKAHFTTGQSHYNLNEFSDALREFKEAYRLYPDAVFLYNLGQCERQLNHPEEAIRFYRSFLREQPKAPNRQEVQGKIAELEAAIKNKSAEPAAPLEPAKPIPLPVEPPKPVVVPAPPPSAPATETSATTATQPTPTLPATPPVNLESASGSADRVDLTATPGPEPETGSAPIYKRWWFWTAAAAVAVGAGVGIYFATAGGGASAPSSDLGANKVF